MSHQRHILFTYTTLFLSYDQSGIRYISVYGILEVNDANETNRLITIYEALETLIDAYSLTIIEDDLSINSAKLDRKSTRMNSSHVAISYEVTYLKHNT